MKYLTYRDLPLLSDWEVGFSGRTWFKTDNKGKEWIAFESEDNDYLTFNDPHGRVHRTLTRAEFEENFNVKEFVNGLSCCGNQCGCHG